MSVAGYYQNEWIEGPFGQPDASRVATSEVYISIRGASLDINSNRPFHNRVVFGKKGAGKTFYLNALQRAVERDSKQWIVKSEKNKLTATLVATLTREARAYYSNLISRGISINPRAQSREFWLLCWEKATIYATYLLLTSDSRYKSSEVNEQLSERIENFFKSFPRVASPVTTIKYFSQVARRSTESLHAFLARPEWDEAEELLSREISQIPPVAFFIDGLDDNFDAAPDAWLDCQHGLFRFVFSLLRTDRKITATGYLVFVG